MVLKFNKCLKNKSFMYIIVNNCFSMCEIILIITFNTFYTHKNVTEHYVSFKYD